MKGLRFIALVATRYIFSKKKYNTINLITGISMCGVAVGAMALVCVLSVINGFERVVQESFGNFDPDLKISSVEGQTFSVDSSLSALLSGCNGVAGICEIIETDGLVQHGDNQIPVRVMGVGEEFNSMTGIDSIMWSGDAGIYSRHISVAMFGIGLANKLETGVNYNEPSVLYAPKRGVHINLARPDAAFRKHEFYTCGVFYVGQTKYDDNYAVFPLALVRRMYGYGDDDVTSVAVKVREGADAMRLQREVQAALGDGYSVQNQYEQHSDFYRILKIEKWTTFLILAFILLIATFNVIGSMSMLMIDKRDDIAIFRSMGASPAQIKALFTAEGWMISSIGALVGIALGLAVCLLQIWFGIIKIGSGYIVDDYPVAIEAGDIIAVLLTVLVLGFAAAYYSVKSSLRDVL